jgi:hypothetical protein
MVSDWRPAIVRHLEIGKSTCGSAETAATSSQAAAQHHCDAEQTVRVIGPVNDMDADTLIAVFLVLRQCRRPVAASASLRLLRR